jgi:hypothetical protein
MKFNLFLLLLITFISVVLSQVPSRVQIQSTTNGHYWALNDDKVVLKKKGSFWIIVPHSHGIFILSADHHDKAVQYNGEDKQLTIEHGDGLQHQSWEFASVGPLPDSPVALRSSQDLHMFAVADTRKKKVVAKTDRQPQWKIIRF